MDKIQSKAINGFFRLIIILGCLLFIPARNLYYWQGWLYLAVFSFSVLFITLYFLKHDINLIERRLNAGPTAEKEKSQKIIQSFAGLSVIALVVVSALDNYYNWTHVSVLLTVVAEIIIVLCFYFIYRVFRENSFTNAIITVEENQELITTGPYSIVRHPMYSAAMLLFVFTPPALGSMTGVVFGILLIIILILRILNEEKFLKKNFPGYAEYCLKVKYRLIPNIW
jgi:protein-S-isoprenylcysteine O-methyltransferase Ste14